MPQGRGVRGRSVAHLGGWDCLATQRCWKLPACPSAETDGSGLRAVPPPPPASSGCGRASQRHVGLRGHSRALPGRVGRQILGAASVPGGPGREAAAGGDEGPDSRPLLAHCVTSWHSSLVLRSQNAGCGGTNRGCARTDTGSGAGGGLVRPGLRWQQQLGAPAGGVQPFGDDGGDPEQHIQQPVA